jgi:AraC family transcriptional activator of pobA
MHEGRISVHHHVGPARAHDAVTHTEYALIYVAAGTARMAYGHPVAAAAGAFILVPAGVPHRSLDGAQTERWAVGFCAACLKLSEAEPIMAPFARVRLGGVPVVDVDPSRQARVIGLLQDLREECGRAVPESALLQESLLSLLLGEVRRASGAESTTGPAPSLVAEALTYIQSHSLEGISLADVAQAVCRSPAHVASLVKAATGYTVGDWIRHARVHEAAAWLLHSDASIDEIAARVGWQDKTHFIRPFKKTYGATPMAWRKARRT